MKIDLLGPLEVRRDGVEIEIPGGPERQLLAVLALRAGEVVSIDALIDALWGEDLPDNARNALQARVSRLRKALGRDVVATEPPGYRLDVGPADVDVHRFERAVADARAMDDVRRRADALQQCLPMFRGSPLLEFRDLEFAQETIRRLVSMHRDVEIEWLEAVVEQGHHRGILSVIEGLVEEDPLDEALRRLQMIALYRSGRHADALAAYQDLRRKLADELGLEPSPGLRSLEERILLHDPGLGADPDSSSGNLPARLTTFVGRDGDVTDLQRLLDQTRLVTVAGPGGAGKTSLAIEAARQAAERFPHGAWLVELAALSDDDPVAPALARVFDVGRSPGFGMATTDDASTLTAVVRHLRDRSALIVLDNCEQVVDEAAATARALLEACPKVAVLATTREPLGVPGERVWRIGPLDTADRSEDPRSSPAVTLFAMRAADAGGPDRLTSDELSVVAGIVDRLDGMPLAIELAAARTRSLPVREIAARLDDALDFLTTRDRTADRRQRTLRDTIDWSYRLLDPREQAVFRRLGLVHGRFDLAMAEEITAFDGVERNEVLDLVEALVDRSMIVRSPGGGFTMLDLLRDFARDRLADPGEEHAVGLRLLSHLTDVAHEADPALRDQRQTAVLQEIDALLPSIRGALAWSRRFDPVAGLALVGRLTWYWYLRGAAGEGSRWATELLEAAGDAASQAERGRALAVCAITEPSRAAAGSLLDRAVEDLEDAGAMADAALARAFGAMIGTPAANHEEAHSLLARSRDDFRRLDDTWGLALTDLIEGAVLASTGDLERAQTSMGAAATAFRRLGDLWGEGYAEFLAGTVARWTGEYEEAERAYESAAAKAEILGMQREVALMLTDMGNVATLRGDHRRAAGLIDEGERRFAEAGDEFGLAMAHNAHGLLARRTGRIADSRRRHQTALDTYRRMGAQAGAAYSAGSLGFVATLEGSVAEAAELQLEAVDLAETDGDLGGIAFALEGAAAALAAGGDPSTAVRLLGTADTIRRGRSAPLPEAEAVDVRRTAGHAREDVGDAAFDREFTAGSGTPIEDAIALARSRLIELLADGAEDG